MGLVDDIMFWTGGSDSGGTSTDSTGTTSGSDSGSSGGGGGGGLSADWVTDYADIFKEFGKRPAGFILGAVLSEILGGIESIVTVLLNAIRLIFLGSDGRISSVGTLGIADMPVYAASLLVRTGTVVGDAILDVVGTVLTTLVEIAASSGALAPVVLSAEIAVVLVATAWVARTGLQVAADFIPGLGGLLR